MQKSVVTLVLTLDRPVTKKAIKEHVEEALAHWHRLSDDTDPMEGNVKRIPGPLRRFRLTLFTRKASPETMWLSEAIARLLALTRRPLTAAERYIKQQERQIAENNALIEANGRELDRRMRERGIITGPRDWKGGQWD